MATAKVRMPAAAPTGSGDEPRDLGEDVGGRERLHDVAGRSGETCTLLRRAERLGGDDEHGDLRKRVVGADRLDEAGHSIAAGDVHLADDEPDVLLPGEAQRAVM